jgi:NADH dehydrogenase
MFLLVGGTGAVGRLVAQQLLQDGKQVRILTRNPATAVDLQRRGAEVFQGDLLQPETIGAALQGVSTLLISVHSFLGLWRSTPEKVDAEGVLRLIDLAAEAGVDHVIYVSVQFSSYDNPVDAFRIKYRVEEHLKASGLSYTILKPNAFMEVWGDMVGKPVIRHGWTVILGRGVNSINFVSVRDVARFVIHSILDKAMRNQVIDIAGPQNLTMNEVAEIYGRAAEISPRIVHIPLALYRSALLIFWPVAPAFVQRMRAVMTYLDQFEQSMSAENSLSKYGESTTRLEDIARKEVGEKDLAKT